MANLKVFVVCCCLLVVTIGASDSQRQAKFGFLGTTTTALSDLAQNLISRSTSSSQVLSLNLTNLVILLVLKALIFGAGSLGIGGPGGIGRSVEENSVEKDSFLSESELLLMLSYLQGDITQKYGCLHRAACQDPNKAKDYLTAGKFLLKTSEIFSYGADMKKYDDLFKQMQDAITFGQKGHECSIRYTCETPS